MAKKSQVLRDQKRRRLIAKHADKRAELRKRLNDPEVSIEEKLEIQEQFAKLPRNSCPTRLNRRCEVSGRSHAYYRKFGISRIALRERPESEQRRVRRVGQELRGSFANAFCTSSFSSIETSGSFSFLRSSSRFAAYLAIICLRLRSRRTWDFFASMASDCF